MGYGRITDNMDAALDWEGMFQVIRAVSMVENLDHFGPTVLEELDALIPSDTASFNEVDPLAHRAIVVSRPRPVSAEEIETWQTWSHQNPSLMYALRSGDGSARRLSDFLTTDELHELEIYTYVYGPLGVEYQLSVALPAPQPTVLGIALNRRDRDFTDAELGLLDALRPHLVQAYRHAQLITEHQRTLDRVAGALEEEGRAFHIVGGPLDGPALAILAHHYQTPSDHLPEPVESWVAYEQAGFHSGHPNRLRQPLVSVRDGRRLTIRFVPGGRQPDLLWLIERPRELDATPLQRLGLSEREAEVLWLLTKGKSTSEIARDLAISTGTVKKHLEHVYRKLGVSTATAAMAQAFDALNY
jgi:DNA-binding CsgD family transcriptional regulator